MRDSKDRTRMSDQFRIRETIDANGHRVIVYEFFGSPEAPSRPRRSKKRSGQASFIKVTFESAGADRTQVPVPPLRAMLDDDFMVTRRGLGRKN